MMDNVLNEMIIINEKASKSNLRYTLLDLSTNLDDLQKEKDYDSLQDLLDNEYNLNKDDYKLDKKNNKLYIKSSSVSKVNLNKLIGDTEANVSEYYGLVQLDGTEPDANGYYNSDYVTMTTMNSKIKEKESKEYNKKSKMRKKKTTESTDAGNIPSNNVSTTDLVVSIDDRPKKPRKKKKLIND